VNTIHPSQPFPRIYYIPEKVLVLYPAPLGDLPGDPKEGAASEHRLYRYRNTNKTLQYRKTTFRIQIYESLVEVPCVVRGIKKMF